VATLLTRKVIMNQIEPTWEESFYLSMASSEVNVVASSLARMRALEENMSKEEIVNSKNKVLEILTEEREEKEREQAKVKLEMEIAKLMHTKENAIEQLVGLLSSLTSEQQLEVLVNKLKEEEI
jgi:UDP-N-acetylglucosamine 2-epimerase